MIKEEQFVCVRLVVVLFKLSHELFVIFLFRLAELASPQVQLTIEMEFESFHSYDGFNYLCLQSILDSLERIKPFCKDLIDAELLL